MLSALINQCKEDSETIINTKESISQLLCLEEFVLKEAILHIHYLKQILSIGKI